MENVQGILWFLLLCLCIISCMILPITIGGMPQKIVYRKNSFDWIVYVLAWIAIPFSIFSSVFFMFYYYLKSYSTRFGRGYLPKTYFTYHKNWCYKSYEKLRRLNLYVFVCFCFIVGFVYLLKKVYDNFNEDLCLICILFSLPLFGYGLRKLWKLMEQYEEKYLNSKLPDSVYKSPNNK